VTKQYWKGSAIAGGRDDGWFHTGDVGALDEKGNLYFKGRKKDVIVTAAGMKVFPEDIEQVLDRQPEIKASAVIPAEGPGGPEPLAVLVLRRSNADAAGAIDRANRSLAEHQHVRRWLAWPDEDFPRTSTQKIRKAAVAEYARAATGGADRAGSVAAAPAASGGIDEIVSRIGAGAPGTVDPLAMLGADLKLDSLGRVELLSAIEDRYQVEIDEAAFTEATTVGDVERIVREGAREEAAPYPYPRWQERPPIRWLRIAMLYILVLPVTRALGRPRIEGRERLRDLAGPAVFIANHVAIVDHALVLLALPWRFRRRLAIAMDGEILRERFHPSPGTGVLRRMVYLLEYVSVVFFFNVFSMPRKSGFRKSFAFAGEMMDRGCSVLIFPEGRTTADGRMGPFMPGTGLLVSELNAPVVPMRLDGLWELKEAHRRRARPGEISVSIGEPARYEALTGPEEIAADLEARVTRLSVPAGATRGRTRGAP
jgi:long-chain acyl-CoA synthetase